MKIAISVPKTDTDVRPRSMIILDSSPSVSCPSAMELRIMISAKRIRL